MSADLSWTPVHWVHREDCVAGLLADEFGVVTNACICGNDLRGVAFGVPRPPSPGDTE